jgi:hypothetical protein
VKGEGVLGIEAGRTVTDMATGGLLEEDGQHDFNAQLCTLLDH